MERKSSNNRQLSLYCKNFRAINLFFPTPDECAKVGESIDKLSNIGKYFNCHLLYIFEFTLL